MKKWLLLCSFFLCVAGLGGLTGCGYDPTGAVSQIRLAIYKQDCVDVVDASTATGQYLQIYACGAGKRSQEWQVKPVNNGQNYMFINANSQMCMTVASAPPDTSNTAPGQYIIQATCDETNPDMVWSITNAPSDEAGQRIVNLATGQCLDLPYGATASVFDLQQYTCDSDDPAQGWNVNPVDEGNTP